MLGCTIVPAQVPQPAAEPIKIGDITFYGSFRTRLDMWRWFAGEGNYDYVFSGNQARIGLTQSLKRLDWLLEFEAPILLGLPSDSVAPAPQSQLGLGGNYWSSNDRRANVAMLFPKQGYLRLKGLFGSERQSLQVGRFEFSDAGEFAPKNQTLAFIRRDRISQRVLGPFAWSHVGRSYDGFNYGWNRTNLNVTLLGAFPTRGAFQVDGWGQLNVGAAYLALNGLKNWDKSNHTDFRVFALYYQDWRHITKVDNTPAAFKAVNTGNIQIFTFGGHLLHVLDTKAGPVDLAGWGAVQTGRWGSLDHSADAAVAEVGWQPKVDKLLKSWWRAGFTYGSGDANPLDNRHNTYFQNLPTPRPYARTPFYDMMNAEDWYGIAIFRLPKSFTVRPELHALRLSQREDLWYQGGGAFQPWTFGYTGRNASGARGLATFYDCSVDWNINARLNFNGYVGRPVGKSVMQAIYPKGPNAVFGYLELNVKF